MVKKKHLSRKEQKAFQRKELIKELLPLGKSFLLWIVLVVIVAWDYTNKLWFSMIFIDFTTYLTYGISKLLFIPVKLLGESSGMVTTMEISYRTISVNHFPMLVELECSAYHAYLAMIALVSFSNWTIKNKLVYGSIIFGILAIVNSLRIVLLGVIGKKFPNLFNTMHDYIWNILLVVVIWGLWELANKYLANKQADEKNT